MSRKPGNRKSARLSVSLDEQAYLALCGIARQDDVSVAWLVRRAVTDLLKGREPANDTARREDKRSAHGARGR